MLRTGLDDNWQKCGSYGPNKYTYHADDGTPQVNFAVFPDFKVRPRQLAHESGGEAL